jgi:hypothetical protein
MGSQPAYTSHGPVGQRVETHTHDHSFMHNIHLLSDSRQCESHTDTPTCNPLRASHITHPPSFAHYFSHHPPNSLTLSPHSTPLSTHNAAVRVLHQGTGGSCLASSATTSHRPYSK